MTTNSGQAASQDPLDSVLEALLKEELTASKAALQAEDAATKTLEGALLGTLARTVSQASPFERTLLVTALAPALAKVLAPVLAEALAPALVTALSNMASPTKTSQESVGQEREGSTIFEVKQRKSAPNRGIDQEDAWENRSRARFFQRYLGNWHVLDRACTRKRTCDSSAIITAWLTCRWRTWRARAVPFEWQARTDRHASHHALPVALWVLTRTRFVSHQSSLWCPNRMYRFQEKEIRCRAGRADGFTRIPNIGADFLHFTSKIVEPSRS